MFIIPQCWKQILEKTWEYGWFKFPSEIIYFCFRQAFRARPIALTQNSIEITGNRVSVFGMVWFPLPLSVPFESWGFLLAPSLLVWPWTTISPASHSFKNLFGLSASNLGYMLFSPSDISFHLANSSRWKVIQNGELPVRVFVFVLVFAFVFSFQDHGHSSYFCFCSSWMPKTFFKEDTVHFPSLPRELSQCELLAQTSFGYNSPWNSYLWAFMKQRIFWTSWINTLWVESGWVQP